MKINLWNKLKSFFAARKIKPIIQRDKIVNLTCFLCERSESFHCSAEDFLEKQISWGTTDKSRFLIYHDDRTSTVETFCPTCQNRVSTLRKFQHGYRESDIRIMRDFI